MLNQPYVLEELAKVHRNDFLKEADAHRIARQVKKRRRVPASLLKRMVVRLGRPLIDPVKRLADRNSFFTDEALTTDHR